ncbi:MAG: phosphodiester glycosidase family protein [Bacteroidales bacterium]|nr:phosphodiester glycosidase family protein [Bacteroidales bacterium]
MICIIKKVLFFVMLLAFSLAMQSCNGQGEGSDENVPEPYIQSITTDYDGKAVAGMPVTLNGLNFSPVAAENKVLYGIGLDAVAIPVNESTEEMLVFTAPNISQTQISIRVSTKGKESNSVTLVFTQAPEPPGPEDTWSDVPTLDFAKLGGTTKTIVEGVEWTTFHGVWEGQMRNINIVRTTLNEHNKLGMYFSYYDSTYPEGFPECQEGEDPRDLDKKCIYMDAIVGTNGPMACCHFARINGEVRRSALESDNYFVSNCAFTIDGDKVEIVKVTDNFKAKRLTNAPDGSLDPPANTLTVGCAGPLLVWEGKIMEYPEDGTADFLNNTHPRTAFGLSKDGKTVIQVAVDGRWTKSSSTERAVGMQTPLLSKLMKGLGCYKAMNFDGGGGTAMWVYGEGNARNIVNRVCENRWDWNGTKLRPTGNAVYIKSDLKK